MWCCSGMRPLTTARRLRGMRCGSGWLIRGMTGRRVGLLCRGAALPALLRLWVCSMGLRMSLRCGRSTAWEPVNVGLGAGHAAGGRVVPLWLAASRGDGQVIVAVGRSRPTPRRLRGMRFGSGCPIRVRTGRVGLLCRGVARRATSRITDLTNGVTYQFEVQAVNSGGTVVGASHPVTATPAGLPGVPPHFMPSAGDGQVVLGWEAAANNGSRIKRYEIQWRQVSDPAQAWSSWSPVSGGRTARDSTVTGLVNGTAYEFEVRAVNGVGAGEPATQSATPQRPPIFFPDRVSYSVQAGSTLSATLPSAAGAHSYETSGTVPGYVEVNTTTRAITIQPENTHVGEDEFIWRARNPQGTDDLTVHDRGHVAHRDGVCVSVTHVGHDGSNVHRVGEHGSHWLVFITTDA